MKRDRLVVARVRKQLTLEHAAELLGVNANTLYKWEAGKATPRFYNIQKLCEVYGASAWELGLDIVPEVVTSQALATNQALSTFMQTDLTLRLLVLVFEPHRVTYQHLQQLQERIRQILEEEPAIDNDLISRREALHRLALLPFATLQLSALGASLSRPIEDILTQCAAGIAACWHLSKSAEGSDLALAFRCVSGYLPTLKAIVKDSSQYRKAAATLAGQCALLQTMLGWHLQGLKEAEQYAQEAVIYSREAQDIPLLVSALDYAAWMHSYAKRDQQALHTIEQALPLLKPKSHIAPLPSHLRGGVYSTLAVMQAKNGQDAGDSLGLARETFFSSASDEPCFVYIVDHRASGIVVNDAAVQYYQGKAERALDALSQVIDPETLVAKIPLPERARIETFNDMARAVLRSENKEMERVIYFWRAALEGALKLHSEQRFSEVLVTYEIMGSLWPREKRITELRDLVVHW
ncbi:MAG: helix-turn-helix transcriptional regulator [Ktedonobacteraceae bacterium]|nr:helix-turn-helix transcriptional regulator [Ktedonobacteraceae bacterium]